ncbi:MAG: substrate-binding domain-containing protein [Bryobacteraceae bacterium]|nr:substrate-binding domain-containing protein [Bryobacteraceae bacterium]
MLRRTFLPAALAIAAAGCRRDARQVVGVIPKGASHLFWQTVHAGAIKASQEYGFAIEWNAPAVEVDSARQIDIVESMVNRRLAGIVLAPVDRKALVNIVERAAREGVPVSIFDSGIDTDKYISYVATDNEEGGRMAARRMGEILGGSGKVGVVGFMPGSASTMERESGFEDEIRKKHPGIAVLPVQFGMASRAKSMAVAENLLAAHPDLAGLFADNESSSAGSVQALKSRGAKQVKLVAFDTSEQLVADMKAGWIDSFVVQNPFKMGYESTRAIGLHLRGETPPRLVDSGAALILPERLDDPEVRELLFPDIKRYLAAR